MKRIVIPEIKNTLMKLFVNDEYLGDVTIDQVNKIRVDVVKYIVETGNESILNDFYFIGHEDSNDVMGKEIKITMTDKYGNLSDSPWEMNHVRRSMYELLQLCNKFKTA